MEIKANKLKNGNRGIITHWVNQPDYVGNTIEMSNNKVIMTDKNGFKTENVDMRYPHYCKVQLNCI
jgi:hypothetical protein